MANSIYNCSCGGGCGSGTPVAEDPVSSGSDSSTGGCNCGNLGNLLGGCGNNQGQSQAILSQQKELLVLLALLLLLTSLLWGNCGG